MIDDLKPYPEYKDSGVEWLGMVPEHWQMSRVRYLFREVDVRSQDGSDTHLMMSQKHGLIASSKVNDKRLRSESYIGGKLCRRGDLVLNRLKAHLGVFATAPENGVISPDYSVFRPRSVDSCVQYFEHLYKTPLYVAELRRTTRGIVEGFWRLYSDDFYMIPSVLPPPKEQLAIVRFLTHADRLIKQYIRAKQKLIKLLEEQKQAIIHRAVTRGLDPNVKLKPSGVEWLGEVPVGWEVMQLKHCSRTISKGTTPSTEGRVILEFGAVRFLKAENIVSDRIVEKPLWYIDIETNIALRRSQLQANDVLFVIAGATLGKTAVVPKEILPANTNQAIAFVRPNLKIHAEYLATWLRSPRLKELIWLNAVQSAQPNLSMESLGSFLIALPPLWEQSQIQTWLRDELAGIQKISSHAASEITLLREYRTRLIADVVTGKLDVRVAAATLPEGLDDPAQAVEVDEAADEELDAAESGDVEEAEA